MPTKSTEKHYVTFYSPGSFFSESSTKPIRSWSTKIARKMAEEIKERYGATPYAFAFSTALEVATVAGTAKKELKRSGMYYLNAKVLSYDELEELNDEDDEILRSNMRGNNWPLIATNDGIARGYAWSQPFKEEDAVVDARGFVVVTGLDPVVALYRDLEIEAWKTYWASVLAT